MRLGILGAGQLGRMLALAARPLDIDVRCLDPADDPPAAAVASCIRAPWDDAAARERFRAGLSVVTYEFENVPLALTEHLAARVPVHPAPAILGLGQDRLNEKRLFERLGIETAPFAAVQGHADLSAAAETLGYPLRLKTRRLGYDGKGQWVIRNADEMRKISRSWRGGSAIAERDLTFSRELSILAVRGTDRETRFYPVIENVHVGGILASSTPRVGDPLQGAAEAAATRVLDALGYVGVLAIEFFVLDNRLVANELAPRVHNSGHATIEGAVTSQFENHVRAVCGLPLGNTDSRGPCAMLNIIGAAPDTAAILAVDDAHLHLYGKSARPGRKLGHVTVCAGDETALAARVERVRRALAREEV